ARKLAVVGIAGALLLPLAAAPQSYAQKSSRRPKFVDLKKVPKPKITGAEIIAGLEEFVEQYPMRYNLPVVGPTPNNVAVSEFLAKEAKGYGFKTRILELEAGTPPRTVRVVEAVKKGTKDPGEWIAFIAHYDTVASAGVTIQGAYDDGSGTNMMRYFAKAFSKIKTKKSIALLWFDAEESGLVASQAYADMLEKKDQQIAAAFGFDMVGIGYPAPYCICIYHGPSPTDALKALPIIDYVNFDFLKFPEGDGGPALTEKWPFGTDPHVCSCGPNIRNSDESNFAEKGYFTMRWTGMRTASDYPGYHHPWDTVPFMEVVAGGRENLEQGTENTFLSAYYSTFVIDNL
ncbi:MAG: M28 family peptidase, partial [Actinomycetota bacterium]|nr:M28 family peptidase [Actinomycetota bacterium]